ncbi:MAG: hypothetical protein PHT77_05590 [Bacteroidales bacterium]|nr:hypothetical protein [Bacteroidales bacterium]
MRRILFLLCLALVVTVTPVSANIIDDMYTVIFGEQNPQVIEWNNGSCDCGSATFSIDPNGLCTIHYTMNEIPANGGIVVELGAFDSAGYLMPVFGGSATKLEGGYTINLVSELQRDPSDKYYVRVVNVTERML